MVKGLEIFQEAFAAYGGQYVLIGGTAASLAMEEAGLAFRSTKDLDIVLCAEAASGEFGRAFWRFVEAGRYQIRQTSAGQPIFDRFQRPAAEGYPAMLELFSRQPGGMALGKNSHLTPLPFEEEISSLSAILMDDDSYGFVMSRRRESGGLSWVGAECLIPLKASAWLDLTGRKERGGSVDARTIGKHRSDVLRLAELLAPGAEVRLPAKVHDELMRFLVGLEKDTVDLKNLGLRGNLQEIVRRIGAAYVIG